MIRRTGLILLFCALAWAGVSVADECRVDIAGEMELLSPVAVTPGASCGHMPWLTGDAVKRNLFARMNQVNDKWQRLEVSFTPATSGKIRLILRGQYLRVNNAVVPRFSCYDDVRVNGTPLENGNFESGAEHWEALTAVNAKPVATVSSDPSFAQEGKSYAIVWHDSSWARYIPVEGGQKTTISLYFRGKDIPATAGAPAVVDEFTHKAPQWLPADIHGPSVVPGSILDLSAFNQGTIAGEKGRAIVAQNGTIAFEKAPEQQARFLGFNWFGLQWMYTPDKAKYREMVDLFAHRMQLQGYNILRPLSLDRFLYSNATKDIEIPQENLLDADYLLAALKKRGIYMFLTLGGYQPGYSDRALAMRERNNIKLKIFVGDADARAHWAGMTRQLLTHVNPHTGVAWKDEPAIVAVEFYNEQDFGMSMRKYCSEEALECLNQAWRKWLEKRYTTIQKVNKAWESKAESFQQLTYPKEITGTTAEDRDALLFHKEIYQETCRWYTSVVREAGYTGLISQFSLMKNLFGGEVRQESMDLVVQNGYFRHPSNFMAVGSRVHPESSLGGGCLYLRNLASVRLADRPIFITEYNHSFWNPYQHEAGVAAPSFAAMQNFSALMIHEGAASPGFKPAPLGCFSTANSPVVRANEFLSAALFRRGDVKSSQKRIELLYPNAFLRKDKNALGAVDVELNKLALLGAFAVKFPDAPTKVSLGHVKLTPPVLQLFPAGSATIRSSDWFTEVKADNSSAETLAQAIQTLRKNGTLAPTNLTSLEKEIFHSETEEILYRCQEKMLQVVTPRTEAVALSPGQSASLKHLQVQSVSVPATVAVIAMDDQPIASSRKMVVIFSTAAANTDMLLSADRMTLKSQGKLPVVLEVGAMKAQINRAAAGKFHFYPLALDGTRREELPISVSADGLTLEVDTGKLANGPTTFFELIAE